MAELFVRTWSPSAATCEISADRSWHEANLVIAARRESGDLDVHDDADGLCLLAGHAHGGRTADEVAAIYRRNGLPALAQLDGHFVILMLDRREPGSIAVVRDRVGLGHAYYWVRGAEFGISTNLPWLVRDAAAHGGPALAPDPRGLALYLTYQYVPAPDSPVRGVRQLTAGAALRRSAGTAPWEVRLSRFPADAVAAPTGESLRAHGDQIVSLVTEAAADRLGASGSGGVGMLLSGGIDTSTNAVVLLERLGRRPLAFTAAFQEAGYDETDFAKLVAAHLGLDHVVETVRPQEIERLADLVRAFDTPNADQAALAEMVLARAAYDHGCRLMVTGEGGDEVLGLPQSHDDTDDFRGLPTDPTALARYYLNRTDLAGPALRKELFARLGVPEQVAYEPLAECYQEWSSRPPFDRVLFGQWRTWMADGVFMKDSRVFRDRSITTVLPMMSTALMEFVAAVPTASRLAGLPDKRYLRAAVGQRLPEPILTRRKHKFWLPVAAWLRGPARDFMLDHLRADGLVGEVVGRDLAGRLAAEHIDGAADHGRVLWALLFLDVWWAELRRTLNEP